MNDHTRATQPTRISPVPIPGRAPPYMRPEHRRRWIIGRSYR
jgi:hypothetical protein